jgi:hypothetical protein
MAKHTKVTGTRKNLIPVKLPENNEEFGNLVEDAVKDP